MDLATQLMTEIGDLGARSISGAACSMRTDDGGFVVLTEAEELHARAVIVASGAKIKRLGIPGEVELEGQGVSQCADCDGPLFQGQDVVVVGGGDSALQEALALSHYARQVHLLHRGAEFRARGAYVGAVAAEPKIAVHLRTVAEAVLGDESVQSVRVKELDAGRSYDIRCSGFFAYPGLEPASSFVPEDVVRDANGFLVADADMRTSIPGIHAVGAVRAGFGGLLCHAIADGVAAAKSAESA